MPNIVAAAAVPMDLIAEPLVPADCTMRGLDFMPLYLDRLMGSRTWARVMSVTDLNLGGYLVNLWGAAFRSVPAGSLEDDDDVLRQATGCPPHLWDRVRAHLMKGWVRCQEDGRVYHRGACDIIAGIWATRKAKRADLSRARAAKAAKREKAEAGQGRLPLVEPEFASPTAEPEAPNSAVSSVTDHKPEAGSEREERGAAPPLPPARRSTRGDLLPDQWCPSAESHLYAQRLGLDSDAMGDQFANRSRGFGHRSHDWQSRFRARCDQIAEQRAPRPAPERASRYGFPEGWADAKMASMVNPDGTWREREAA
jgi:hypothetical protein